MPSTYSSPWYYLPTAALLAIALAYWGWMTFRTRGLGIHVLSRWTLALMLGPLWIPALLIDEVRLDNERLQWNPGFWWNKEVRSIEFSKTSSIRVEYRKRLRHRETVWVITKLDGSTEEAVATDIWLEHYDEIKSQVLAHGIPIASDA